jgi:hypothetical protein
MRVGLDDVLTVSVPKAWDPVPALNPHQLMLQNRAVADGYLSISWQGIGSPPTISNLAKWALDPGSEAVRLLAIKWRRVSDLFLREDRRMRSVCCDWRRRDRFYRKWVASDGRHIAYFGYASTWNDRAMGVPEAERIVRSLRFSSNMRDDATCST